MEVQGYSMKALRPATARPRRGGSESDRDFHATSRVFQHPAACARARHSLNPRLAIETCVIASPQHPLRGPPPAANRLCPLRIHDGRFEIFTVCYGPWAFFWYPPPVFLRGAARRGNLRDPGCSFTGSELGVLNGRGTSLVRLGSRRLPRRSVSPGPG